MEALEKYQDKVNWRDISSNPGVMWTVEGINKFADKISWEDFSRKCPGYLLTEDNLLRFKDKWNWTRLSYRKEIFNNRDLLDKVTDMVDWSKIITNHHINNPVQFFKRYEKFIPMSDFQYSRLWDGVVEAIGATLKDSIDGMN